MKNSISNEPIRIHRSLVVFVWRLLIVELLFGLLYIFARIVADFLNVNQILGVGLEPYIFFQSLAFFFIEISLVLFVVLHWLSNYYIIKGNELIVVTGILVKKEQAFSLSGAQAITYEEGIIGRLLNYGDVHLFSPILQKEVYLSNVPDPKHIVDLIETAKSADSSRYGFMVRRK